VEWLLSWHCRDVRPAAHLLSLCRQRKKAKKTTPAARVPSLRCGQPAVLGLSGVCAELAFGSDKRSPDPLSPARRRLVQKGIQSETELGTQEGKPAPASGPLLPLPRSA